MSIPFWCLVVGVAIPYLLAGASTPFRNKLSGSYDIDQPREQAAKLTDAGARAWAAQLNAWEALAVFTVATILAHAQGVDPAGSWATASVVWVVARVLHGVFYIAGQSLLRILSFAAAMGMSIWIIVMAANA